MDHIPSRSISKSILIVTPLFLLVLAVLHTSSELSYLFILKFINNVAGSADITFVPSIQPEVSYAQFVRSTTLHDFKLYQSSGESAGAMNLPLINKKELDKWASAHPVVQGVSSRWLLPIRVGQTDAVLLVMDVSREQGLGLIDPGLMPNLDEKQLAMEATLMRKLGYEVGDVVKLKVEPRNFMSGVKLLSKFKDMSSDDEFKPEGKGSSEMEQAEKLFQHVIRKYNLDVSQQDFSQIFEILYNSTVEVKYSIKKAFYPEGIYASAINNVVILEQEGFTNLVVTWLVDNLLHVVDSKVVDISKYVPSQARPFIPKNDFEAQGTALIARSKVKQLLDQYSLISVCRLNNRQSIYHPNKHESYQSFASTLEQIPSTVEAVVVYPFFEQSLAIKFFFDSVIQIFEFVTCIIYFYTMTLIMKQIYEEKEIQVGIWRTLGAGGVAPKKNHPLEVEMREGAVASHGSAIRYSSQFEASMSIKQKLVFAGRLAIKVGFAYYWLATAMASVLLYFLLKLFFYGLICLKLNFTPPLQPVSTPPVLLCLILLFVGTLVYQHIKQIYTNPLSETIKPVKRTFDVVKVRVIHIATFGVTLEVLLIAGMLVYYGVISYYWIPFAILDGQNELQVTLFNSIFLAMIFGSIILLSILQARLEVGIFGVLFRLSPRLRSMKLAILKNIKAKQYKNIKVAIIISIIFAFVLFFTAGINIEMQIIQSFIERALGANLVFENYEQTTFATKPIDAYLYQRQGISHAWLSKGLSRDNVSIELISHISNQRLTPEFQVLSPSYLNSTFYQYYYPEFYMSDYPDYQTLPNSVHNGFNSIYDLQEDGQSIGEYNQDDTLTDVDPYHVNLDNDRIIGSMAPQEQVINLVVSSQLRKQLGVNVGDYYKMRVANTADSSNYFLRARITHSFKAGPGFDMIGSKAFMSDTQAAYIYRILGVNDSQVGQNEKLFIQGSLEDLKGIGPAILPISPEHTQMFEIEFVSQSFGLLQKYLSMYVVLITAIMSVLVTIFIFLYTMGKCREEADMYKMLRAIGLSATSIRTMVFLEVIIRLIIALLNGIVLGVVFSVGFSLQIEQFLMIKTPLIDIRLVSGIGVVLICVFGASIIRATRYLAERTVAETNKV